MTRARRNVEKIQNEVIIDHCLGSNFTKTIDVMITLSYSTALVLPFLQLLNLFTSFFFSLTYFSVVIAVETCAHHHFHN